MRLCRSNNAVTDLRPGFIIGAQYRHPRLRLAQGVVPQGPDCGVFAPD